MAGITRLTQDVLAGPGTGTVAATVVRIQSVPVSNAAPATGDFLTFDGAKWKPDRNPVLAAQLFANFSNSTSQTAVASDTAYYANLDTTDVEYGGAITITNNGAGHPTRVTFSEAGYYEFAFSAQIYHDGGTHAAVSFWLEKNRESGGGPFANSASQQTIGGTVDAAFPFCAVIFQAQAGDYFEVAWSSTHAGVQLLAIPAAVGPVRPADPSLIVVVKRIGLVP